MFTRTFYCNFLKSLHEQKRFVFQENPEYKPDPVEGAGTPEVPNPALEGMSVTPDDTGATAAKATEDDGTRAANDALAASAKAVVNANAEAAKPGTKAPESPEARKEAATNNVREIVKALVAVKKYNDDNFSKHWWVQGDSLNLATPPMELLGFNLYAASDTPANTYDTAVAGLGQSKIDQLANPASFNKIVSEMMSSGATSEKTRAFLYRVLPSSSPIKTAIPTLTTTYDPSNKTTSMPEEVKKAQDEYADGATERKGKLSMIANNVKGRIVEGDKAAITLALSQADESGDAYKDKAAFTALVSKLRDFAGHKVWDEEMRVTKETASDISSELGSMGKEPVTAKKTAPAEKESTKKPDAKDEKPNALDEKAVRAAIRELGETLRSLFSEDHPEIEKEYKYLIDVVANNEDLDEALGAAVGGLEMLQQSLDYTPDNAEVKDVLRQMISKLNKIAEGVPADKKQAKDGESGGVTSGSRRRGGLSGDGSGGGENSSGEGRGREGKGGGDIYVQAWEKGTLISNDNRFTKDTALTVKEGHAGVGLFRDPNGNKLRPLDTGDTFTATGRARAVGDTIFVEVKDGKGTPGFVSSDRVDVKAAEKKAEPEKKTKGDEAKKDTPKDEKAPAAPSPAPEAVPEPKHIEYAPEFKSNDFVKITDDDFRGPDAKGNGGAGYGDVIQLTGLVGPRDANGKPVIGPDGKAIYDTSYVYNENNKNLVTFTGKDARGNEVTLKPDQFKRVDATDDSVIAYKFNKFANTEGTKDMVGRLLVNEDRIRKIDGQIMYIPTVDREGKPQDANLPHDAVLMNGTDQPLGNTNISKNEHADKDEITKFIVGRVESYNNGARNAQEAKENYAAARKRMGESAPAAPAAEAPRTPAAYTEVSEPEKRLGDRLNTITIKSVEDTFADNEGKARITYLLAQNTKDVSTYTTSFIDKGGTSTTNERVTLQKVDDNHLKMSITLSDGDKKVGREFYINEYGKVVDKPADTGAKAAVAAPAAPEKTDRIVPLEVGNGVDDVLKKSGVSIIANGLKGLDLSAIKQSDDNIIWDRDTSKDVRITAPSDNTDGKWTLTITNFNGDLTFVDFQGKKALKLVNEKKQ